MELVLAIPVPVGQEIEAAIRRAIPYQNTYQDRAKGGSGRFRFRKALTQANHFVQTAAAPNACSGSERRE
jgi:hypothetical protein